MGSSNAEKIKLIVYVNFGILAIATAYVIYAVAGMLSRGQNQNTALVTEDKDNQRGLPTEVKQKVVYVIVSWVVVVVFNTVINLILLKGLTQRSHSKCLVWLILAGIGTIYQIYRVIYSFVVHDNLEGTYLLFWTSISIYGMYIVKSFMSEIKSDSTLQPLASKP